MVGTNSKGSFRILVVIVLVTVEMVFFGLFAKSRAEESRLRNAVETTTVSELREAMSSRADSVMVYGRLNVDEKNGQQCVKPDGATKSTPCYVAMRVIDESYEPYTEYYDCGTKDNPQRCSRVRYRWETVNDVSNTPDTVEMNGVSLPYNMMKPNLEELSSSDLNIDHGWDGGGWTTRNNHSWGSYYDASDYRRTYYGVRSGVTGVTYLDFSNGSVASLRGFKRASSIEEARSKASNQGWCTFYIVMMVIIGGAILVALYSIIAPWYHYRNMMRGSFGTDGYRNRDDDDRGPDDYGLRHSTTGVGHTRHGSNSGYGNNDYGPSDDGNGDYGMMGPAGMVDSGF